MAWNDEAKISCAFRFKCPKVWDNLRPTQQEGIRHCPECNRDVHLALTEEDFRRHADEGQCVAVRVLHPVLSAEDGRDAHVVGNLHAPYNSHLKPLEQGQRTRSGCCPCWRRPRRPLRGRRMPRPGEGRAKREPGASWRESRATGGSSGTAASRRRPGAEPR